MEVRERERTEAPLRVTPLAPPEGVVAYAHEWSARGRARAAMLGVPALQRSDLPRTPSLLDRLRAPLRSRDPNSLPPSAERALGARIDAVDGKTLHAFGLKSARHLLRSAQRRGVRLIVSLEESDLAEPAHAAPLFEIAERLLVPSRAAAKRLEAAGCPFRKVIVAPYGVQLRPMRPRRSFQRGLLRAVAVARLVPHEGDRKSVV